MIPLTLGGASCSVAQSYLTLCDPMDRCTPGFPVLHYLLEFAQVYVHWISDAIELSHALPPSSPRPFASRGQSIGTLTLASVLSVNIPDWFPLGLTRLISLQSKWLSRIFSSTTFQKHPPLGGTICITQFTKSSHNCFQKHPCRHTGIMLARFLSVLGSIQGDT